jgi:hypothetical protein
MVMMITVLTVNLLTGYLTDKIIHYELGIHPYKKTLIGMVSLVFILVPAYSLLHQKIELLAARILVSGSNSFGRFLGLLLTFSVIFFVLFLIYLHNWFGILIWSNNNGV